MKKIVITFLFLSVVLTSTSVFAFGGGGSGHTSKTYGKGVDALGIHIGGEKKSRH